jgi:hypothetical protein
MLTSVDQASHNGKSNKGVVSAAVCHEKVKLEKNWSMDLWCVLHRYLPRAELILKFD